MRIRILIFICYGTDDPDPILNADPDPDHSFQIKAQTFEKVLHKIGSNSIHFGVSLYRYIDADPGPDSAYHFVDADPDLFIGCGCGSR
jgi:hypothetical protein